MKLDGTSPYSTCRFDAAFVYDEVKAQLKSNDKVILLVDGGIDLNPIAGVTTINYYRDRDTFLGMNTDDHLVMLAIDHDEIASQAVADVMEKGAKFVPIKKWDKAFYYHNNLVWRQAGHVEFLRQKEEGFSKWDLLDFDNLVQALDRTVHLEGDYLEIGCFQGSSGSAVLSYLNAAKRKQNCWFIDVFDGFNYETAKTSSDAMWLGTHMTEGVDAVAERLRRFQTDDLTINVVKADIIETQLPDELEKIAVANIDVDIYEAVLEALVKCAPRIVKGGFMFAEDAGHTPPLIGAKRAVDDFCAMDIAREFTVFQLARAQYAFIKTGTT